MLKTDILSVMGSIYDTCILNAYFKYKIGFSHLYLIGLLKMASYLVSRYFSVLYFCSFKIL